MLPEESWDPACTSAGLEQSLPHRSAKVRPIGPSKSGPDLQADFAAVQSTCLTMADISMVLYGFHTDRTKYISVDPSGFAVV
jgi:hypothetical protein